MHARLRTLWIGWSVLTLGMLLACAIGLGWLTQRAADQLAAPELRQTADVIGQSISREIERALNYKVPIDQLVEVNSWFKGIVDDNAMLDVLVLTDKDGKQLAAVGVTPAVAAAISQMPDGDAGRLVDGNLYLGAIVLRGADGSVAGRLLVGSVAPPLGWAVWCALLSLALVAAALVSLALRALIRQRLHRPLAVSFAAAEALADGVLLPLPMPRVRDPATQYQMVLAERLHALRRRSDYLMLKIGEVRAAHFDPAIVASLDQLAQPLAAHQPRADAGLAQHAAIGEGRLPSGLCRALGATLAALLVLAACGYGLHHEMRKADTRRMLDSGDQLLQQTWLATLDDDRVRMNGALDRLLARPGFAALLAGEDDRALDDMLEDAATPTLAFAVFALDGTPRVASGQKDETTRIDALILAPLRDNSIMSAPLPSVHGIWQNVAHAYQSGVARRMDIPASDGSQRTMVVMAAQPLDVSLAALRRRLQQSQSPLSNQTSAAVVETAAADLRGQPLGDGYADLVADWSSHGRADALLQDGQQSALLVALGLTAPTGHALGTLMASLPLAPQGTIAVNLLMLACLVVGALALASFLLYLRALFLPLAQASRRLERLADGDTETDEPEQQQRETRQLYRMVRRIAEKMDALETLRRSRERQGKRQARFIRLQMMQLAERLDDVARRGILEDLARIEHASRPAVGEQAGLGAMQPDDPRLERIVDEFGILALGFQNLVSRVGQQYQELDRLVAELREALRTKTQFIALQQELEIARKMQLSILPRDFDANRHLALHAVMQPAKEVGGDFYDFFAIDAHRVALVIADVSGKGVPAAFFMAISRTLLRAVAPYADSTSACIARVNDLLAADNEEMMFVTLFYAILDTRDGSLTYTNAGHNPPYLLRATGGVDLVPNTRGTALAVAEGLHYREGTATLQDGDALFLFTDGITEAAAPDEELFGDARLAAALAQWHAAPVDQVTAQVVERIKLFEAGGPQADDVTCLMARYQRAPHAVAGSGP
ncbi:serine phosphatase RsbU (regulator of sigma subunit) [Herbaspirillum sp. 1173]|uniref:PP2C family protein-serine/threonine phosphatase n=1 Tax=Herbaspirillum sp. 1173 TaxID=2817734 RepID=UPI0028561A9B|nr:PP2C family protein-serine/threonine phosphatase [Herbaspirillum sp. 1173]MDR6739180.1 serine phosphatase RsbU (regulator of sigma subunit) [Herbaspirillum sp. 1173]